MVTLFIAKGDYAVQPIDILDTLNGGSSGGDLVWYSGTSFKGILHHANTVNQTYTMPNASGTVALLNNPQTWTGLQTYNSGTIKVNNILFNSTGLSIIGGSTLQIIQSLGNGNQAFIKDTIGNDGFGDVIVSGGTIGSSRGVVINLNDAASQFNLAAGGVNYLTYDANTAILFPIDNTVGLGKSGKRYTAVWAVNGTIQTSFSKYKKEIVPLDASACMAVCKRIDSIFFKWNEGDGTKFFGINADPLREELPEAVTGDDGVFDRSLIALLFGAVRYLSDKVEKLENNS